VTPDDLTTRYRSRLEAIHGCCAPPEVLDHLAEVMAGDAREYAAAQVEVYAREQPWPWPPRARRRERGEAAS
jgi:hypothetical protein